MHIIILKTLLRLTINPYFFIYYFNQITTLPTFNIKHAHFIITSIYYINIFLLNCKKNGYFGYLVIYIGKRREIQ
jgi:hypothetical protein